MVTSLKKISVRYVQMPAARAEVVRETVLELQAESILKALRHKDGVNDSKDKTYGEYNSEDNGRN